MIRFTLGGAHWKWFVFVRSPKFAIGSQWRSMSYPFTATCFFIHSLPGACSAQRKGKEFEGVEIGWGWSTSPKTVSLPWPSSSPVLSNPMKLSACLTVCRFIFMVLGGIWPLGRFHIFCLEFCQVKDESLNKLRECLGPFWSDLARPKILDFG